MDHQAKLAQTRAEWQQKVQRRSEERMKLTRARNIERLAREASLKWDDAALLGDEDGGEPFEHGKTAGVQENLYECLVSSCVDDLRARTKHHSSRTARVSSTYVFPFPSF